MPRARRLRLGLLAGMLALVAVLAVGEWSGWPLLAGPVQRALSQQLHRAVSLQALADGLPASSSPAPAPAPAPVEPAGAALLAVAPDGFRVRFLGGVHLTAPWLTVAAPDWSPAPYLVQAQDLVLDLRYVDLWRAWRGQPLHVQSLQARRLDAHLQRLADGRASWQFGVQHPAPGSALPAPALPVVERLEIAEGRLQVQDVLEALLLRADLSLEAAAAPALGSRLQVRGQGHYRGLPLTLSLSAAGVLPGSSLGSTLSASALPLSLSAQVGRASLRFDGSANDPLQLRGLSGRFTLQGPSLAAVGDALGLTLPTTAAFRTRGRLARRADSWSVLIDDAAVGTSLLNGAFVYRTDLAVPLLAGRLGGSRLHLADLGPAVGLVSPVVSAAPASAPAAAPAVLDTELDTAAAGPRTVLPGLPARAALAPPLVDRRQPGKVLPNRPFDLAALRAMDADVLIDFAEADLNTHWLAPLRPLRGHLRLTSGVLTLSDLDARTAQGRLGGQVQLDGRSSLALWTADLRWDGVRLEDWVRQTRANSQAPYVSGQLGGRAKLAGQGRSTAEILASLRGTAHTELTDGAISHLALEAAGLDLAQALGLLVVGDDALPVACAVADLVAERGVFRPRVMVLDTTDSVLWVDGTLSLATEALDLRAVVSPRDFSPLALRSPLHVQGSFAQPKLSLELGRVVPRVAAAALLALINPLAALIPLIDTGDSERAGHAAANCSKLMTRHSAATGRSAAVAAEPSRKTAASPAPKQ